MRSTRTRLAVGALLVLTVGFARSSESTSDTLLQAARTAFPSTHKWFGMVADLQFDQTANGELSPNFATLKSPLVRTADGAGQHLSPLLPASADGTHTISLDGAPGVWVRTRDLDATPVHADLAGGVVVYPGAVAGGDLLYKLTPTHVDEYVYLATPPAFLRRRASIELGPGVRELRPARGRIEVLDLNGIARLRVTAPFARAADGTRRQGSIALQSGMLVSELDLRGLVAPILVDPDWATTGTMTVGHWADAAWRRPDNKVMVVAGCALTGCPSTYAQSACGQVLADTEIWEQTSGTWTAGPPLQEARYSFASTPLMGGDFLVAGGCTAPACPQQTANAERFDTASGQWKPAGSLSSARANAASVALGDGQVLIIGGCATDSCVASVDRYNPASDSWDRAADLPAVRGFAVATVLKDKRVLLTGGCADAACATQLSDALLYDPDTDSWTSAGTMTIARAGHTASLLNDGRVLVVGGCADAACKKTLANVELWTANAQSGGAFQDAPTIPGARHNHTATLLPTGEVLIAGGVSGAVSSLPSATAYVPSLTRWIDLEPMKMDRAYHVSVLLPNGEVMLGGGCNVTTCMPWCEVFSPARLPELESMPPTDADGGVAARDGGTSAADGGGHAGTGSGAGTGGSAGASGNRGDGGMPSGSADAATVALTPHPPLYRLGASKCATGDAQELRCPQLGWPRQDADFAAKHALLQTSADEVTDPTTHLVWQRKDDGKTYNQEQAMAYCAQLSTAHTHRGDWRVPSVVELATLIDYARNTPSVDTTFIGTAPNNYWSRTPVATGTTQAWTVKVDFGEVIPLGGAKTVNVKCVRDEDGAVAVIGDRTRLAGDLVASADVVSDEETGLQWQRRDDGVRRSWGDSLAYCAALSLDGKQDWHLPSAHELRGLVEYGGTAKGAVIDKAFQDAKADLYWTATPNDGIPTLSWSVSFNLGIVDGVTVTGITYARCVRHLDAPVVAAKRTSSGCSCRVVGAGSGAHGSPLRWLAVLLVLVSWRRLRVARAR